MKSKNLLKTMLVMTVFALCLAFTCAAGTTAVQAKTVTAAKKYKKAKKIRKGNNLVRFSWNRKGCMYVKFTAPKKGKYTFTFSNLQSDYRYDGKNYESMWVKLAEKSCRSVIGMPAKTEGGKTISTYVCSQDSWNVNPVFSSMYSEKPVRTLTKKLKKGKTVWLEFGFSSGHAANGSFAVNVRKR